MNRRGEQGATNRNAADIVQATMVRLDTATEGTVELDIEYDFADRLTGCSVAIPSTLAVDGTRGFRTNGRQYDWDGATNPARLSGSLSADTGGPGTYRYVDAGDWAIVQRPQLSIAYQYRGAEPALQRRYDVDGEGVTSSDGSVMYLGPHDEYTDTTAGQRFRLVVPEAAALRPSVDAVLSALGDAAARLDVGGRNDEVLAIAAPTGVGWGSLGVQSGANGFWTQDDCRLDNVNNTWIHEYVHTRQEWDRSASTKWLVEATTEYYASLFTYRRGQAPFSAFHDYVSTNRDSGSVLVDPKQWTSSQAYYTKGRRVLAALDLEIREATGGESTFQDVFRRINAYNRPLTHTAFVDIVAEVAGRRLDDWLDRYVCGSASPEIPDDEGAFKSPSSMSGSGGPTPEPEPETEPEPEPETEPEPEPETEPEPEPETEPATIPCPVCSTEVSEDRQYCPACGQSLHEQCPVCGTGVEGEVYCPECGSRLEEACPVCDATRVDDERFCERCGHDFEA
ncbi:hypothetical protein KY092_13035 [Natronomonas gomsonensis]|uniref:double zinc ribbon domain-containing protein n=1 Tax=Natronomonas gomsonensis TaxID=1046043 RepID=UPI00227A6DB3|nr:zinc ribbon domain-containing protein [Natronomonas gomsonensis]MCY4731478.1 hypothetical protein [Natronomonas gomsonensis]